MVLFGYSYLDLLTDKRLDREELREEFLNRVSVNGYMRSLDYASDMTGLLHQDLLLKVFASPSYEVSARTYQTYLKFTAAMRYPHHPPFRALKGNCQRLFWNRFEDRLENTARRTGIACNGRRSHEGPNGRGSGRRALLRGQLLLDEELKKECSQVGPEEHVIIAIPPERLSRS